MSSPILCITVPFVGNFVHDNQYNFFRDCNSISCYFSYNGILDERSLIFTITKKDDCLFYYFELPIDEQYKNTIDDDVYVLMESATFSEQKPLTPEFASQFELLTWSLVGEIEYNNI